MSSYPISITLDGHTFTKHFCFPLVLWGELRSLSDDQVLEQLRALLPISDQKISDLASWVALNPGSQSFDFPEDDHTRALLGALRVGQLSID
jgi:hypothetical protein